MSKIAGRLLATLVCLLPVLSVEAVTRTWVGPRFVSWSDPSNWSPAGVPANGDNLVITYGGFGEMNTTNDLPGLVVGTLTLSNAQIEGNALTVTGDIALSGNRPVIFDAPVTLGASVHISGDAVTDVVFADIDVNGNTLVLDSSGYFKTLSGSGTIKNYSGYVLSFDGGSFHGTVVGNAAVRGDVPNGDFTGLTPGYYGFPILGGFGTVGDVAVGSLYPGYMVWPAADAHTAGTLHARSLQIVAVYGVDLSSTDYDSVIATGPVTLSGQLVLSVATGNPALAPPTVGQNFIIIDNQRKDPVNGTFESLPEGSVVQLGALYYRITYKGGDGNDVALLSATKPDAVLAQNAPATVTGEPVTLTASVTSAYGVPTGVVTFTDNGNIIGAATLSNGVAQIQAPLSLLGNHSVVASYAGAGLFVDADSAPLTHTVGQGNTSTALATVTTTPVYGDAPIRITSSPLAPAAGVVDGEVTLLEAGNPIGSGVLQGGSIVTSPLLSPGTHTLTASYAGSPSFLSSNSVSTTVTIGPAPTRLDVSRDEAAAAADGVVLDVFANSLTVVPATPTGTLTLIERGVILIEQPISGNAVVKVHLAEGHHTLSILYSGDENFLAGTASFDVDVAATTPARHRGVHH